VQAHGWRLLPLYRFNPRSGEWKHASRLTRFPERKWLATLRWPAEDADAAADVDAKSADADADADADDVDADGARAARGASLRTAAAEAALDAAWASHLASAGAVFAAGSAEGALLAGGGALADAYGGAGGGGDGDGGAADVEALRWFALPREAAAALASERAATSSSISADALAAGSTARGEEMPAHAAVRRQWRGTPPGPVRPKRYSAAGALDDVSAAAGAASAGDVAAAPLSGAAASARDASWADASRKHPRRDASATPPFADLAALAALRHGAAGKAAAAAAAATAKAATPAAAPAAALAVAAPSPAAPAAAAADSSDDESPLPPPPPTPATAPAAAPAAPPPASATPPRAAGRVSPPKPLMRLVSRGIAEWDMIRPGDRLLLGLSGGKDSLALLHILLDLQRRAPVRFELAAATVDPGTEAFNPRPLIGYVRSLGIPYHFLENRIFEDARSGSMAGDSICAFCARMKRGALYSCAREHGYTTLVLGQHADDFAESLLMSLFHNGRLRTMQAAYVCAAGDVRIIRPLLHVREAALKAFSYGAGLPVIADNCPACFEAPKERARLKKLLKKEESMFPRLFANLGAAMTPLVDPRVPPLLRDVAERVGGRRFANKPKWAAMRAAAAAGKGDAEEEAGAADVGDAADDVAALSRVSEAALLAELARRGGLGVGAAAAGAGAEADEAAEDDAAAASGGACAWRPRPPSKPPPENENACGAA
jgi:tRNA(Ile)-lysidine synthase TilS/MesJ